jgi:hypothetical protein
MFDAKKFSDAIRSQKKKMMTNEPELIGTSPQPDMDAQDVYDMEQHGRVESTLDSPEKSDADKTMMNESYDGVGLSPEDIKRMGRLRGYFDSLDMD